MKRAIVCGAGGFIGWHLVNHLKREGYWVRGVDLKGPEFEVTQSDEFKILDLRDPAACESAIMEGLSSPPDEVYQLAADMGGMGFIHSAECEIMHNSALINAHMIHAAAGLGVRRYFERAAMAYGRRYGIAIRIARFQNCYGPMGTWRGGREKHRRPSVAKPRRHPMEVKSRYGAMVARSEATLTSTTWSEASGV